MADLDQTKKSNPASVPARRVTAKTRIPMSLPRQNLEVPERDGWHRHWFLGRRVEAALAAGYEYVSMSDVELNNKGVADGAEMSGSSDLGSRVSKFSGLDENNQPEHLYLMEIPEEWYLEDQRLLAERNDKVAQALRAGLVGAENDPEKSMRYLKQGAGLFFPKSK